MNQEQYNESVDRFRITLKKYIEENHPKYKDKIDGQVRNVEDFYTENTLPVMKPVKHFEVEQDIQNEIKRLSNKIFNDFIDN
jgi:hypothetical protein